MRISCAAVILATLVSACGSKSHEAYEYTELVLGPGTTIEATTRSGTVRITYVDVLTRRFSGEGFDETRTLTPRKERFGKRLGAYDPGEHHFWQKLPRVQADESQLHFESLEEARKHWVFKRDMSESDWVVNDEGLVVMFYKSADGNHLAIDIFQVFVSGEKPEELATPGSNRISILRSER